MLHLGLQQMQVKFQRTFFQARAAGVSVEYTLSVAPCFMLMASTYSISSITSHAGIKSVSHPPKAVVKLYFRRKRARSAEAAHVSQTGQLMHSVTLPPTMGQLRL
jgi:hypothetical protein